MPKKQLVLPEKYYLTHFNEFIGYITEQCNHLLNHRQRQFIQDYQHLPEDTQCMLVRVLNRQGQYIELGKMVYTEISHCELQISRLKNQQFLRSLDLSDITSWLSTLTKGQLITLLAEQSSHISVKTNAKKSELLAITSVVLDPNNCLSSTIAKCYLVKTTEQYISYFRFLFFGHLKSGLNQFSLRDLGVISTRKNMQVHHARFDNPDQSNSAFYYANQLNVLKKQTDESFGAKDKRKPKQHIEAIGSKAHKLQAEYFFAYGIAMLGVNHELALEYLLASSEPKAQEKWLREQFKLDNKSLVKRTLEDIIDNSSDDALLLFAEDFYQRKFNQVKLSKLTQKLRNDSYPLVIDQTYQNQVEKGVQHYYQRLGIAAFRTENHLFNALFGLTFWQELYHLQADALATEFDRRPKVIKNNSVYTELGEGIEQRLQMFLDTPLALIYLSKIATKNYGQANGMFRWHSQMLKIIGLFINAVPGKAVINHLRAMAKNYHALNDGYPDLMLIDNDQLRFVEVKAPGDAIRPNQFVTNNALQQAGFDVRICQVKWSVDPFQPYVVVDIETTGGKQPQHRITEIGAVKIIEGKIVDKWSSLINPQRHISKFITRLTGIDNEMVQEAPLFCEIAEAFLDFVQGCIFVAHNVNFDYGFIKQEFQRLDRKFSMPKMCTVRETRKVYPGLKSYSLGNLCSYFDIPLTHHHRALCDAEATAELLSLILQQKTAPPIASFDR